MAVIAWARRRAASALGIARTGRHNRSTTPTLIVLAIAVSWLVAGAQLRTGVAGEPSARSSSALPTPTPYVAARPILDALRNDLIPRELSSTAAAESIWPDWMARRDAAIRARVMAGDDESVLNLLLFGTTFTKQPRATEREIAQLSSTLSRNELTERRIEDLIAGAARPGDNARLQFVRDTLGRHGFDVTTAAGRQGAGQHLREGLEAMVAEIARMDRAVESARLLNRPAADLLERSTLFRDRGLSTDTSIFSSFAIDRALEGIGSSATLRPGSVQRVAIVGPGLDFVDKRDGYDFYPAQTIQPFAVIDSLLRFELATVSELRVTTMDLNPRINHHLAEAVARARAGAGYSMTLARDLGLAWTPRLAAYWQRFGDRIADTAPEVAAPQTVPGVQVRTVRARPEIARALDPSDLNIVVQRFGGLPAGEQFDLIVATDILLYYDVFEQSLALANIAAMLRPGGLFLSNAMLFELPVLPIDSIGYNDVIYLESPEIGDRLVWYRRK